MSSVVEELKSLGGAYTRNLAWALRFWFKVSLTLAIAVYVAGCLHNNRWITPDEWRALMRSVMRWITPGAN
jgi:hypothetical protein